MQLANIVNGKAHNRNGKHRTTLIVAAPSILNQWFHEIGTHVYTTSEDKHGIDGVIQFGAGNKIKSNNLSKLFLDNDIVLTTYNEVVKSFAIADENDNLELTDPVERQKAEREYFEKNKGVLHSTRFLRIVLDEAQIIKNHASQTSRACRALMATHYWAMTGT